MTQIDAPGWSACFRVDGENKLSHVDKAFVDFYSREAHTQRAASDWLGVSFFSVFANDKLRELYEDLFDNVRSQPQEAPQSLIVAFRCDGPAIYRHMQLTIRRRGSNDATNTNELELESRLLRVEQYEPSPESALFYNPLYYAPRGSEPRGGSILFCDTCSRVKRTIAAPHDVDSDWGGYESKWLPIMEFLSTYGRFTRSRLLALQSLSAAPPPPPPPSNYASSKHALPDLFRDGDLFIEREVCEDCIAAFKAAFKTSFETSFETSFIKSTL